MSREHDSAEVEKAEFQAMRHQFAAWKLYKIENERVSAELREIGKGWETGSTEAASEAFRKAAATIINRLRLRPQANFRQLEAYKVITENPPSLTLLQAAVVFSRLIALTELAVIVATVLLSDQSAGALVVGTILAGSCYVAGKGLGTILFKLFERPNRDLDIDEGHIRLFGWVRFTIAILVAAVMAWLRWRDAEEEATAILAFTGAFSVLVVCLTAFAEFLNERYVNNFQTYFLGESSRATKEHGNDFQAAVEAEEGLEKFDTSVHSSWIVAFNQGIMAQRHLPVTIGGPRASRELNGKGAEPEATEPGPAAAGGEAPGE